jgi:hypothetical protein
MTSPTDIVLLYFILPLWLVAGFADWLCHRATHIESTTGPKESLLHLLMFLEVGIALLAGLFLQIDAGVIALMIVVFFIHEATALWDVSYAVTAREVTPIEQHVHSFLEMLPLFAIVCVVLLHWEQFLALLHLGPQQARFTLELKSTPLPTGYVSALLAAILLFELLPYLEELRRGYRARRDSVGSRHIRPV